jgi:hypothetical protein
MSLSKEENNKIKCGFASEEECKLNSILNLAAKLRIEFNLLIG